MTSRETIRTLLNKELPERIGLNEHFWPHIIDNTWGAQGIAKGTNFIERFNLDLQSISWFSPPGPRPDLVKTIEESDEWTVTQDSWGARLKHWKHKAGTPEHVGFSCASPEIWHHEYRDAIKDYDVRTMIDLAAMRERYAKAMAGERFVTYSGLFVFEDLRRILGDIVMLESLLLEPEWIHDFNRIITTKNLEWYQFLFNEVGKPDGIHIYDDLGYTNAPFASPACHREMIFPYHKELFGFFKDHGLPVILHTCGDFRPHLQAIVDAGADCIQAMEAKTGMDVVTLAKQWKDKLCFMGNIDIQALESGDRDRIREECVSKLKGMKKLRAPYVYMSDHSISTGVKLADYEYMLELYHANNRY